MESSDAQDPTPLAQLLGTIAVDEFFASYFPGRHLLAHGSLDRLPAFFYSGVLADPRALSRAYRGPVFVTNRTLGRFEVHGVDARECFEELGLTVGFTDVHALVPGACDWLRALEAELGMPRGGATLSVFVNGRNSGLSAHCDPHEQIAIHLRGPKEFRLRQHAARFPHMKHVPGIAAPPHWLAQSPGGLLDVTTLADDAEHAVLQPGSMLFTPRGLYHETVAGDECAMTAVIAFRNPTPAELVTNYLHKVLTQSEEWRRPLDFGWADDSTRREPARARMATLLRQLGDRVASLSMSQLFGSVDDGARKLADSTRLQREPSTKIVLCDDGDRVRLEIGLELGAGDRLTSSLPIALSPMLHWLAEQRAPFTVGEACERFADWDRSAVVSTIRSLLRTRVLVELPFEAW